MPETKEQAEERALRELEGKNVAHYSVLLSAWIETKMERDKTLVTLSAAAIGLLVTILTTVGVSSAWEIPLFAISVVAFLVTIWSSLVIYQLNSKHLEDAIRGSSERDPRLEKYDKRSIRAFIIGGVTTLLIGILSASTQLNTSEGNAMTKETKNTQGSSKPVTIKESVNGITGLNPSATSNKDSLDGITNLNPQARQQSNQSQTQTNTSKSAQGSSGNNEGK